MKLNFCYTALNKEKLLLLICLLTGIFASAQPVADFTSDKTAGCKPLTVSFKDSSSGNPTSWKWDFGNGGTSGFSTAQTIFTDPGYYAVKLVVSNAAGTDSITKTQYITVYEDPVANFSISDTIGCLPFTTKFIDQSTTSFGTITSWEWIFDDYSSSALQNPTHNFASSGNYSIALKVTNSGGCVGQTSKSQSVKVYDSLIAKVSFPKSVNCKPPETIQFTNLTSTSGTSMTWQWNFGDGGKSSEKNPKHTYNTADSFTVSLIVTNNYGCTDTLVLKDSLVTYNVLSKITGPDTICVNSPATFVNATVPSPLGYDWIFSDGDAYADTAAVKTWDTKGVYNLKLINYLINCKDSVSKNITVIDMPVVDFTVNDTASCKPPLTINFTDKTANGIEWQWDFGDGSSPDNTSNPIHTYLAYPADSAFSVTLTAKNKMGCVNTTTKTSLIKIIKPIININTAEGGGCIPYIFKPLPDVWSADGIVSYQWNFGDGSPVDNNKNPSHTYNALGNYDIKLVVTTTDGCMDSITIKDGVKIGTKPTVDFNISTNQECAGTNVQLTDLSSTVDKWLWSFGDDSTSSAKNPLHAYNDTGTFSIKLIAWNNGCADSITKKNIINIKPAIAKFGIVYDCADRKQVQFNDSSILAQTWLWDFGDGTTATGKNQLHTYAVIGNYNVTLTVTNGTCTDTIIKQVKLIDENPVINTLKDSVCRGGRITFTATATDTANIQKYLWDFGDGKTDSASISAINHAYNAPGNYVVKLTIRDIRGCTSTFTKTSNIEIITARVGFTTSTQAACLNAKTNVIFTDTSATPGGIKNWTWNFGDGTTVQYNNALPPTISHVYSTAGIYYPRLRITDGFGCTSVVTSPTPVTVTQPTATFSANHVKACNNDPVVLYNNSLGSLLTYRWDFGDGTLSTDSAPRKIYTTNGTYSMKLVVTDKYGCTDSMVKNNFIDVKEPIASFTASDSFGTCLPFIVEFINTSVNAYDHLWDLGDGTSFQTDSTNHPYSASGVYLVKLTATRSPFCVSVATKTIEVNAPNATFTYSPTDGCAPLNVTFQITTTNKLTYEWDFRDGFIEKTNSATTTHSYSFPGQHIPLLLIKDSSGCIIPITGKNPITLYNTKVGFTADRFLVCDSGSIQFTDTSISGSGVKSYLWKFGDGQTSTIQNPVHFYNTPGNYTISLYISTVYGCTDSLVQTAYIKVAGKPSIGITADTSFCGPSIVNFSGTLLAPDSIANWQWNFANGNTSTQQNPLPQQYNDVNTYQAQLIAVNNSGCSDTAYKNIYIHPVPVVSAGNDTTICLNNQASLQASGADNYTWTPAATLSCSNCVNPIASPTNSIVYSVKGVTVFGCEATDDVAVEVKHPFNISGLKAFDSICNGSSITLAVTGAENYSWSPAEGLNNTTTASVVASPGTSTSYKVIGYDSKNCFKDSATINLKVNPTPTVNAGNDQFLTVGNSVSLNVLNSADVTDWLWTPSTYLSCSTCPNPIATPEKNMEYTITVNNNFNCIASDKVSVFVTCNNTNVFLPTAFTPNNDGLNDYFYPMGTAVDKIQSIKIFNRYGEIVFLKDNFKANERNTGWDGTFKGSPSAIGSYIYYIEVICKNGEILNFSGKILLLR